MMFLGNRLRGVEKPKLKRTYLGQIALTNDATTYTFEGFVAPAPGLVVCVGLIRGGNSRTVESSVVAGGASGLITGSAAASKAAIAYAEIGAGTFDVSFTLSGSNGTSDGGAAALCGVYLLQNYRSVVPVDSEVTDPFQASSRSISLNTEDAGIAIYGAFNVRTTADTEWLDALEDYSNQVGNHHFELASKFPTAAAAPFNQTAQTASSYFGRAIGASWR